MFCELHLTPLGLKAFFKEVTLNEYLCECLNEPMGFDQYNIVKDLDRDETNGRFGEVELWQCKKCGRFWLHYLVEYEAFKGSGRYFMGLITQEVANALAPDKAIEYLDQLEWHLYGGSYFGRKGKSTGKVNADL